MNTYMKTYKCIGLTITNCDTVIRILLLRNKIYYTLMIKENEIKFYETKRMYSLTHQLNFGLNIELQIPDNINDITSFDSNLLNYTFNDYILNYKINMKLFYETPRYHKKPVKNIRTGYENINLFTNISYMIDPKPIDNTDTILITVNLINDNINDKEIYIFTGDSNTGKSWLANELFETNNLLNIYETDSNNHFILPDDINIIVHGRRNKKLLIDDILNVIHNRRIYVCEFKKI